MSDFDEMTRPTTAFVTFEEEDAVNLLLNQKDEIKIFEDEKAVFIPASQPTDILWENRYLKGKALLIREVIAYSLVVLVLFAGFLFMFFLVVT
jgi:hypothetical protein